MWRDIPDYELYEISDEGQIRNKNTNRILKPQMNKKTKYHIISLYKNKVNKCFNIHTLVMRAFHGDPPEKHQVDHINRIKTDNRLENLRYVTSSENNLNKVFYKLSSTGERNIYNLKGKYLVQIMRSRKTVFQQIFDTIEEAIAQREGFFDSIQPTEN